MAKNCSVAGRSPRATEDPPCSGGRRTLYLLRLNVLPLEICLKLTVWCALWAGGIIGPFFFKNDKGHNVTVNGDRYRTIITNFFIPESNNHDVQELWFQQDGATCHTARATIDLLKDTFGDRLISRFGLVNWPPRSCDLTPLDYFLLGYVKSLVYADKPQTLDHLEDNVRRVIADIRPQMLEKVIEN
ncbi:putative transposable element [Trichonephila clavipes]|nr:putative transposable element [Trichonephila clavipes]